jgi:hypothetical protein
MREEDETGNGRNGDGRKRSKRRTGEGENWSSIIEEK